MSLYLTPRTTSNGTQITYILPGGDTEARDRRARPREAPWECRGPKAKSRNHSCSGRKAGTHRDRGPLRAGVQAGPANSRTRTWGEWPPATLSASPGPSRDPLQTLANHTSPLPYAPLTPYPQIRVSVSRSLLEKWRRESCPIDRSECTPSAHVQRACSRAPSTPAPSQVCPSRHLTHWHVRDAHSPSPS